MAKASNVNTGTYIYRMGTAPNTRAAVSQKNKIYGYAVGAESFQQIGVVSEFTHDESRTIDPVRGVGYGDQVAELVPSVTDPMSLTLNKTLLYTANLFQVLGYKGGVDGLARSLKHHRWPFDIKQELVFSELSSDDNLGESQGQAVDAIKGASSKNHTQKGGTGVTAPINTVQALVTFFEGCWMNSYSTSYASDSAMVTENGSVTVTDIIDGTSLYGEFQDTGLAPTGDTGGTGAGYSLRFAAGSQASTSA